MIRLGVDITLRETASAVYDWTADDETIVAASAANTLPGPVMYPRPMVWM